MTRDEFVAKWSDLRDAQLAPWARDLCERVITDARQIEVEAAPLEERYDTHQAARFLGRTSKTIANMCAEGMFPNAKKTSKGKGGKWIIPSCDIQTFQQREAA